MVANIRTGLLFSGNADDRRGRLPVASKGTTPVATTESLRFQGQATTGDVFPLKLSHNVQSVLLSAYYIPCKPHLKRCSQAATRPIFPKNDVSHVSKQLCDSTLTYHLEL